MNVLKRQFLPLILVLILLSVSSVSFSVTNVSACQTIDSPGVYNINTSLISYEGEETCFDIILNDVVLDCKEGVLEGTGSTFASAIRLNSVQNVSILNCIIEGFSTGLNVENSNLGVIENVSIKDTDEGITLLNSNDNTFSNIVLNNSYNALVLTDSTNNDLSNIHFDSYNTGIRLDSSYSNSLKYSSFIDVENSDWNIYLENSEDNVFALNNLQTKDKIENPGSFENSWTYEIEEELHGNYWDDLVCSSYENLSNGLVKCVSPDEYTISTGNYDSAPLVRVSIENESASVINEYSSLNYNESIEEESKSITQEHSNYLSDNTWFSENNDLSSRYSQQLGFYNGVFNYYSEDMLDEIRNKDTTMRGIYYNSNEVFAVYEVEFHQSISLEEFDSNDEIREEVIGTPLTLLGNQYIILDIDTGVGTDIEDESDSLQSLTLGKSSELFIVGQSESVTLEFNNGDDDTDVIDFSLIDVTEEGRVFSRINGEYHIQDVFEIIQFQDYYFTAILSQDNKDVEGIEDYAEFIVSKKIIELHDDKEFVAVNGYEFNVNNELTNYVITSDFSDFNTWNIKINYSLKDETILLENESLEDAVFDSFALSFDGIHEVEYSEFTISTSTDEVDFKGKLHNGDEIPSEFRLTTDDSTDAVLYLGSDEDRIYHKGSDLTDIGADELIQENSYNAITHSGTTVEFDLGAITTSVDGNMIFSRVADDEFYLYEISSVDRDDLEVDFTDLFSGRESNSVDIDDIQNELELNTGVATYSDDKMIIDTAYLGDLVLYLENYLQMNFSNVESDAFTSSTADVELLFTYNEDDIEMDDYSFNSFNVSLQRSADVNDPIELDIEDNDFIFQGEVIEGADVDLYVDTYGTEVRVDTDDRNNIEMLVPNSQVNGIVNVNFGEIDSIALKGDLNNEWEESILVEPTDEDDSWYVFCKLNCTLDYFEVYVQENNLTSPLTKMDYMYGVTQIHSTLLNIVLDRNLSGYHTIILGLDLSDGTQEIIEEKYLGDYEFNVSISNSPVLPDEELLMNISFLYEPILELYPTTDEIFMILSYYNQSSNSYEEVFDTISDLEINSSGMYNFSFPRTNDFYTNLGNHSINVMLQKNSDKSADAQYYVYENAPELFLISIENNSVIQSSNRGLELSLEFDSLVYGIEYENLETNEIYTASIAQESTAHNISITSNYGNNLIKLMFSSEYGVQSSYVLNYTLELDLKGSINDSDGDGINDSSDTIFGNVSNVLTNVEGFNVEVNNTDNLSQVFNDVTEVVLYRESEKLVEFENNFSSNPLNLTSLIVKDERVENESKLLISGLDIEDNTKTVFLELLGDTTTFNSLCIKDAQIDDFADMTQSCIGDDEIYVTSIPSTIDSYSISYTDSTNSVVEISGLTHSGVSQMCTENWDYGDWSTCLSGIQERGAIDLNNCGTTHMVEELTQVCEEEEEEDSGDSGGGSSGSSGSDDNDDNDEEAEDEYEVVLSENSVINFLYEFQIDGVDLDDIDSFSNKETVQVVSKLTDKKVLVFDFYFSNSELDLSRFDLNEGKTDNEENFIIVSHLELNGRTKTAYLDKSSTSDSVCIKDTYVDSIEDISDSCSENYEYLIACDGKSNSGYKCVIEDEQFKISGLKHSAVKEVVEVSSAQTSSGGSSRSNDDEEIEEDPVIELYNDVQIETSEQSLNLEKEESRADIVREDPFENTQTKKSNTLRNILIFGFIVIVVVGVVLVYISNKKKKYEDEMIEALTQEQQSLEVYNSSNSASLSVDTKRLDGLGDGGDEKKESNNGNSSNEESLVLYQNAKSYIEMYKDKFSKEQLENALRGSNYPEDVIKRVLEECY